MKLKIIFILATSIILFVNKSSAQWTVQTVPDPKNNGWGFVSNPDKILKQTTVDKINEILMYAKTDSLPVESAVIVLKSIGDKDPKSLQQR